MATIDEGRPLLIGPTPIRDWSSNCVNFIRLRKAFSAALSSCGVGAEGCDASEDMGDSLFFLQTDLVISAGGVVLQLDQALFPSVLQEIGEAPVAVVSLVEVGVNAADRLFDHRAPQRVVIEFQRLHDFHQPVDGLLLLVVLIGLALPFPGARFRLVRLADQVVVIDEFVAGGDEQVRGGAFHTTADHPFLVLLELGDQRREVAVAGEQGEEVDVMFGIAQVQRVDHHVDIGAILAAGLALGDVDQLDALAVELAHGVAIVAPVAVGPLVDDASLFQQPLEDQLDLEGLGLHFADAEGQILEIDKDGDQGFVGHQGSSAFDPL